MKLFLLQRTVIPDDSNKKVNNCRLITLRVQSLIVSFVNAVLSNPENFKKKIRPVFLDFFGIGIMSERDSL